MPNFSLGVLPKVVHEEKNFPGNTEWWIKHSYTSESFACNGIIQLVHDKRQDTVDSGKKGYIYWWNIK